MPLQLIIKRRDHSITTRKIVPKTILDKYMSVTQLTLQRWTCRSSTMSNNQNTQKHLLPCERDHCMLISRVQNEDNILLFTSTTILIALHVFDDLLCMGGLSFGSGKTSRTPVPWRQGFRHPIRNECMGWFAQIPFSPPWCSSDHLSTHRVYSPSGIFLTCGTQGCCMAYLIPLFYFETLEKKLNVPALRMWIL